MNNHILVITSVYPRSRTDRYGSFVKETAVKLKEKGMKITVFAPSYKGLSKQKLDNIIVYRFRYFFKKWENLTHGEGAPTKINNPIYFLIAISYIILGTWQLFWVCKKEKPDFLHVHWPFPHGIMALASSLLLNIPMVFSFHGAELLLARKFGFVALILKKLLPYAKNVTSNSSFTKRLIQDLSPKTSVNIIPYGLTLEVKSPQKKNNQQITELLFVGRLIERKGLSYLLEALPIVLKEFPVRLRVVGEGDLKEDLMMLSRQLNIDKQVDFLGFLSNEDLATEYATCDIFVLPSIVDRKGDTEGLGIVMIEALAHQKPVVATRVGGIVDVVNSGKTGFLVPQKNPNELANAILTLISDPLLANKMGIEGLKYVQTHFSWERIIPLWQKMF